MSILLRVFVLLCLLVQGTLVNEAIKYARDKGTVAKDLLGNGNC